MAGDRTRATAITSFFNMRRSFRIDRLRPSSRRRRGASVEPCGPRAAGARESRPLRSAAPRAVRDYGGSPPVRRRGAGPRCAGPSRGWVNRPKTRVPASAARPAGPAWSLLYCRSCGASHADDRAARARQRLPRRGARAPPQRRVRAVPGRAPGRDRPGRPRPAAVRPRRASRAGSRATTGATCRSTSATAPRSSGSPSSATSGGEANR